MAKVTDILTGIKKRANVEAVILTTDDGLTLDSVAEPDVDIETIAAYAASYASSTMRMGEESNYGALETVIVVYKGHAIVVAPVDKSIVLAAIGVGGSQIGKMHIYMQRIRGELAAALQEESLVPVESSPAVGEQGQRAHTNGDSAPTPFPHAGDSAHAEQSSNNAVKTPTLEHAQVA